MTKLITTIENHTYEVDVVKADPHRGEWQVRVNGELLTVRLPDAAATFINIEWLVVQDLLKKLGKHTTGKGCLYVKSLKDVDAKVLKELIQRSVKATKQ